MSWFPSIEKQDILHRFLKITGVRHTKTHLKNLLRGHPYADSLLAISDTLQEYNIPNTCIRIDEASLTKLSPPFIAQIISPKSEFVIVTRVTNNEIILSEETNKNISRSLSVFLSQWTGIVLVAEPSPETGEKDYSLNRRKEILQQLRLPFIIGTFFLAFPFLAYLNASEAGYFSPAYCMSYGLCAAGICLSILLTMQSSGINSGLNTRICTLMRSNGNCSKVLESPVATFKGIISWSGIGLAYFTGSLLVATFVPEAIPLLFLLAIVTLPYTIWSIYYQKMIIRQWCTLCLGVQLILWLLVITQLLTIHSTGNLLNTGFRFLSFLLVAKTAICFILPVSALWFGMPFIASAAKLAPALQTITDLKQNESLFKATLMTGPDLTIDGYNQQISFGSSDGPFVITLVTNPICGPCADVHRILEKMLLDHSGQFRLQIIFAANPFEEDKCNGATRHLIAAYLQYEAEKTSKIFADWFETGRQDIASFKCRHPVDTFDPNIELILRSHMRWCELAGVNGTPSLFIGGRKLPDWYKLEDIGYFIRYRCTPFMTD